MASVMTRITSASLITDRIEEGEGGDTISKSNSFNSFGLPPTPVFLKEKRK